MKKISSFVVLIALACSCNAQNLKITRIVENPEISTLRNGPSNDYLNSISAKAVRQFKKAYKNVIDEKWYTMPDGYRVNFMQKGVRCRCDYDKKGHWQHTIWYYTEEKLPLNVRRLVADTYPNHSVRSVEEISLSSRTLFHVIHLEGPTNWVNIKVFDGEIYELQTINKSR